MIKYIIFILICNLYCSHLYAGGVSLGATRLVYPTNKDQVTLKIYNTDEINNYLVQSWVSDENDNKISDFIITPPLFIMKSNTDNILKIVYAGEKSKLPKEKEKLYFLNSKVIPSLNEHEQTVDNALLISTTTKIKLFVRPFQIHEDPLNSHENLKCTYDNNKIRINNPTPFFMNLVSIRAGGKEMSKVETIPPGKYIYIPSKEKDVKFNVINDYGVQIKDIQCKI